MTSITELPPSPSEPGQPSDLSDMTGLPAVIDQVALARLYGEPLFAMPQDLYIPPDALQVFLIGRAHV